MAASGDPRDSDSKQQPTGLRLRLARLPREREGASHERRRRVGRKRPLPPAHRGLSASLAGRHPQAGMRNSGEHGDMTCRQHSLRPRRPIVELQQVPKRGIEHRPGRRPFIALEARHPCRGAAPKGRGRGRRGYPCPILRPVQGAGENRSLNRLSVG